MKLRPASESVGWLNSVGPLATSPTFKPDPSVPLSAIRALVRHFGWCMGCVDHHGSYPESVSCYCHCHDGAEERWPGLRDQALAALCPAPPGDQTSEIEQLRALVREAFNAGYHCRWTCKEKQYVFDPVLAPGDPDGAYWAWWQQTRPGRLNPDTLEFK